MGRSVAIALVAALAACGRLGFDTGGGGGGDGSLQEACAGVPPDSDAVAWYRLDEDPSAMVVDASGSGRHGECDDAETCPASRSGLFDGALEFRSAAEHRVRIDPGESGELTSSGGFTLSVWAMVFTPRGDFLSKRLGSSGSGSNSWEFGFDNSGDLWLSTDSISESRVEISTAPPPVLDAWTHYAASWDPVTGARRIYIDGAVAGSTIGALDPGFDGGDVFLGADEDFSGPPDDFFDGMLDDVRIYPRALSDGEIGAISDCRP